jgi:hypothetical protein
MSVKLKATLPEGHGHTADRLLRYLELGDHTWAVCDLELHAVTHDADGNTTVQLSIAALEFDLGMATDLAEIRTRLREARDGQIVFVNEQADSTT